ncbi:MAG TPA: CinA family nicotinamide mononucleotide deamidase-related protein [Thermoanaerobaculaceae bacterium]|nr:CinA family nicotinamide mononucleotide deamidase-related protein [Thermoanaerobaculaceae bacterium]
MTAPRPAAFVAVGSELVRTDRLDTNSLLTARLLGRCGYALVEKRCVEDDVGTIAAAVGELLARTELVVISGGLGPTADDVTREGVSRALGLALVRRSELEEELAARYRRLGRPVPPIAFRMAEVLEGAEVLRNPLGTAPGQLLQVKERTLVLLPGVPSELEQILTSHLLPRWVAVGGVVTRTLRLAGVYESQVEQRVSPLYERFGRERVTILAARGQVSLVLSAFGPRAPEDLATMEAAFAAATGADLYGRDEDTLPGAVLELLGRHGWRLATAESCTGGLVGFQLTALSGASNQYVGGVVAYSNQLKEQLLGVPGELLAAHGAVSREAAEAMAQGACALGAECGLAVTGIAGPTGGSAEKPVGTVHIGVATPHGAKHSQRHFGGNREMVREFSANFALDLLRRALVEDS